jgi:hypothetical protein
MIGQRAYRAFLCEVGVGTRIYSGIKWIGWGIGTGNRLQFRTENHKHALEAGSPPPYLVFTLQLNTAARPDSTPNPVEHR